MGVSGFPSIIQAIPIGVLETGVGSQLCLIQICQAIPIWVTEGAVVRIWESLILLSGLSLGVYRGYWYIFAFNLRESFSYRDSRLPSVKGVETVLYFPSIV